MQNYAEKSIIDADFLNPTRHSRLQTALVILLPMLGLLQVNLIGQLFLHELILSIIFFLFATQAISRARWKDGKLIAYGAIVWLLAQIISDMILETPFADYSRGWAKIAIFGISFVALLRIINTPKRAIFWGISCAVPMFFRPFQLYEGSLELPNLWKFGIGPAILLITCAPFLVRFLLNPSKRTNIRAIGLLHLVIGVISFFMNSRSFAGITILTGLGVLALYKFPIAKISRVKLVVLIAVGSTTAMLLATMYAMGAESGTFGIDAQEKYRTQALRGSNPLMIVLGGRSESLVSTMAISDSPIIGHGSWAKDINYLIALHEIRQQLSESPDYRSLNEQSSEGLIPSHSYLLGAWVESGIVGGLFWASILIWTLTVVLRKAWACGDAIGLYCLMSIAPFIWNILFSPFGAYVRVDAAGLLAIFVLMTAHHSNRTK